ncbi:MAG TPA: hypothetical protein VIT92_01500 [Burkholderiaceae bacterium]
MKTAYKTKTAAALIFVMACLGAAALFAPSAVATNSVASKAAAGKTLEPLQVVTVTAKRGAVQ